MKSIWHFGELLDVHVYSILPCVKAWTAAVSGNLPNPGVPNSPEQVRFIYL